MAEIKGPLSGASMEVEAASKAGRVILFGPDGNPLLYSNGDQPATPSGLLTMGSNDGMMLPVRVDRFGSAASASHQVLLTESFEGTTINTQRWLPIASTMAATQSPVSGLLINSGNIVTVNTGYLIRSTRKFAMSQRQPMQFKFRCRMETYANSVQEYGIGDATTFNGLHTNGAFIQINSAGVTLPVLYFNSSPKTGAAITGINPNNYYSVDILKDDDSVTFSIQDTTTGEIINKQTLTLPIDQPRLFATTELYVFARVYNTGVAPVTAPHLHITDIYCSVLDANYSLSTATMQTLQQRDAIHNPLTGVQLAQFANSVQPASAVLSNTAAGYTALGGKFQFAAVVGAVTDYALFGFTVPDPLTLVITSIDIETWNTGATSATTPTLLEWFAVENQAAVTLVSATGRVGIGQQSMPVGAVVGAAAPRLSKMYQGGLVTGPGRFFVIGLRMPVGSATASQIFSGQVNLEGYFL